MEKEKSPYTPFERRWDGHDHSHFIHWAHRYYSQEKSEALGFSRFYMKGAYAKHRTFTREDLRDVATRLYKTGMKHHVLDLDFESFWQKLHPVDRSVYSDRSEYHQRVYKPSTNYDFHYPKDGAHFRCKVPLSITEKKVLTEELQQKREWREKKGFARDKSMRGWSSYQRLGCKTGYKKLSNRCFRRYERNEIAHGRYEDLFVGKRKDYFDPWDFY